MTRSVRCLGSSRADLWADAEPTASQAEYEGSIPFTRSIPFRRKFREYARQTLPRPSCVPQIRWPLLDQKPVCP